MKIHFICLHIEPSSRAVPLGAAMIAGSVRQQFPEQAQISVINCYLTDSSSINLGKINRGNPDCICFSVYLWNTSESVSLIKAIKTAYSTCTILVGGPQPTALPDYFSAIQEIDYVISGEAEAAVIPLFRSLFEGSTIPKNKIIQGIPPELSNLCSPYLSKLIDLNMHSGVLWELSRGCPYRCAFCFESRGSSSIRRFPDDRIRQELELFHASGVGEVLVLDPTFNYNKKKAKQNLQMMIDSAPDIHYTMEIRAEHIDEEMADLFSQLYCSLQIGLQSIHAGVLEKINRSFNMQEFTANVLLLHNMQVPYGFDLIYGLPGDSLDGFLKSLDFAFSMVPNHIDIFPLSVLPGTELYDKAASYELSYHADDDYTVTHTPTFTAADMQQASRIAHLVERFYNQGKAVSWFDILLNYLQISPSEFFTILPTDSTSLAEDTSIIEYQLTAVEIALQERNITRSWKIIRDIIRYFWHANNTQSNQILTDTFYEGYHINPQLQLCRFEYNPLEIIDYLEHGIQDFDAILSAIAVCQINLAIYETDSGIQHYECSHIEYELLEAVHNGNESLLKDIVNQSDISEILNGLEASGLVSRE